MDDAERPEWLWDKVDRGRTVSPSAWGETWRVATNRGPDRYALQRLDGLERE